MSTPAYVRICPVCGAVNAADTALCSCGTLLTGVDLSPAPGASQNAIANAAAPDGNAPAPPPPQPKAEPPGAAGFARVTGPRCPHPDCGAANLPGATRCVYCDRPLAAGARAFLDWPWGGSLEIVGQVLLGRDADLPRELHDRLEKDYDNVSRRHAMLRHADGALTVEDLGSRNGTFLDGRRLAPCAPTPLANGARLRFAADLTAVVRLEPAP